MHIPVLASTLMLVPTPILTVVSRSVLGGNIDPSIGASDMTPSTIPMTLRAAAILKDLVERVRLRKNDKGVARKSSCLDLVASVCLWRGFPKERSCKVKRVCICRVDCVGKLHSRTPHLLMKLCAHDPVPYSVLWILQSFRMSDSLR